MRNVLSKLLGSRALTRLVLIAALAAGMFILLPAAALPSPAHGQLSADFGDAPDNTLDPTVEAYPGVPGRFPSLLNTANASVPGNVGPFHLTINEEWLADPDDTTSPSTTAEANAKVLPEEDEDDARFVILCYESEPPAPAGYICSLFVSAIQVSPSAPDVERYVNAVVDLNRDGNWEPSEHVIKDHMTLTPPGEYHDLWSDAFSLPVPALDPVWVRVTLTRSPLEPETMPWGQWAWDGSVAPDGLAFGETEDQLVTPVLSACVKEPPTNFKFTVVPGNPINLPPGNQVNFWIKVTRVKNPLPCMKQATGFKLVGLDWCWRVQGSGDGVDISSVPPNKGVIDDRVGKISSLPFGCWPAPPLGPPWLSVNIPFLAGWQEPRGDRFDVCRYKLAVDPDGEVAEYVLNNDEVAFKEPGVGGAVELFVDSSEPSARPAEGDGAAPFPFPAMAGTAAVAAIATVALAAGGWYARRHLS
jgi:hypothetical protein